MLHFIFAVKQDSEAFNTFLSRFKNNKFKRDDLKVELNIDSSYTYDFNGRKSTTPAVTMVSMVIRPIIVNTSALDSRVSHMEVFNKYFQDCEIEITESGSEVIPYVLVIDEDVIVSPVHYVSTFGDWYANLENNNSNTNQKELIDLILTRPRQQAHDVTAKRSLAAIFQLLLTTHLCYKQNGSTSKLTDAIITGDLYLLLSTLDVATRAYACAFVTHFFIAFKQRSNTTTMAEDYRQLVSDMITTVLAGLSEPMQTVE